MILVDTQIKEAIESGDIVIGDFSEKCLQPASYDMRIGDEGFTSDSKEITDIKKTPDDHAQYGCTRDLS